MVGLGFIEPAMNQNPPEQRSRTANGVAPRSRDFLVEVLSENRPAFKAIVTDVVLFSFALLALVFCFLLLQCMGRIGYPETRIMTLESLHYWAYLVVFSLFMLDLIFKLCLSLFRRPPNV